MMRTFIAGVLLLPAFAFAAPSVLVDAIPEGGTFVNYATVDVPIRDLSKVEAKEVEAGLASAVSNAMRMAEKNGITHICLLSAAGDDARAFSVQAASASLKLSTRNPSFTIVLYREGVESPQQPSYSLEKPAPDREIATVQIKKISVPQEWTVAAWIYFNLPRMQAAAVKSGAAQIFLQVTGKGSRSAVVVPRLKEPMLVPTEDTAISASWYVHKEKVTSMTNPASQRDAFRLALDAPAHSAPGRER